jgi:hypothetical protein
VSGGTAAAVRAVWESLLGGEGEVLEPGLDRDGLRVG